MAAGTKGSKNVFRVCSQNCSHIFTLLALLQLGRCTPAFAACKNKRLYSGCITMTYGGTVIAFEVRLACTGLFCARTFRAHHKHNLTRNSSTVCHSLKASPGQSLCCTVSAHACTLPRGVARHLFFTCPNSTGTCGTERATQCCC